MGFLAELGFRLVRPALAFAPNGRKQGLSKGMRWTVPSCAIARRGNLA
jgi:hypothetical protein